MSEAHLTETNDTSSAGSSSEEIGEGSTLGTIEAETTSKVGENRRNLSETLRKIAANEALSE